MTDTHPSVSQPTSPPTESSPPPVPAPEGFWGKWGSIATIVALFLTIGGLVWSAGYQIAKIQHGNNLTSISELNKEVTRLLSEVASLKRDAVTQDSEFSDQVAKIIELTELLEKYESQSSLTSASIRHQVYLHATDLCGRLSPDKMVISRCVAEIDTINRCMADNEINREPRLIDGCLRRGQAREVEISPSQE